MQLIVIAHSLGHVRLFVTTLPAARQATLSFTTSWTLLKLTSMKSVMPPDHFVFCLCLITGQHRVGLGSGVRMGERSEVYLPSTWGSDLGFKGKCLRTASNLVITTTSPSYSSGSLTCPPDPCLSFMSVGGNGNSSIISVCLLSCSVHLVDHLKPITMAGLPTMSGRPDGWAQLLLLLSCFSCVRLCATPEMAAHQAPPSLGFSRQEHWSGLPFPSPLSSAVSCNERIIEINKQKEDISFFLLFVQIWFLRLAWLRPFDQPRGEKCDCWSQGSTHSV